ncbi:aldo-keto reductase-10 [Coleophoma cylindrospora]|uniref:Aldo-keto reductase-10 n=1 Tax=Coleophoma cylindrospora TaxID=1849047 RepID=A0A3D8SDD3_9HELO|nr:aldo-keto reductase-10 [Coleophoma cylindrospora]
MASNKLPAALQATIDATKVTYTQLGSSGLRISVPVLGTMSLGTSKWLDWVADEKEALQILKGAWDRGLNTWDTANMYSNGVTEELIGKAIKTFDIPRHKLILMTKCFHAVGEETSLIDAKYPVMRNTKDYVNQNGLSRAAIFNAVESSLRRLDTAYIDILQIHRYDPSIKPEETMKALHDLVQSGKVRYIGASSMWAYQFATLQFTAEKNGWTKFISMQNQYNVRYREEEREMNKFCKETGVGLLAWSPNSGGLLTRPLTADKTIRSQGPMGAFFANVTDADKEIVNRVQKTAEEKKWTMSQVALAWLIQKDHIPIVGCGTVERLDEACAVTGKVLTTEEMKFLEEPYVPTRVTGHV